MKIRGATLADATAVARLAGQLGYPTTPTEARNRLTTILQADNHRVFVADLPDNPVVGWVHIFGACYLVEAPSAEVGGLVVDEAERGQGVGKALLETAEEWAMVMGYNCVRVRSNIVRAEAHRFYRRMGYDCLKTSFVFTKSLVSPSGPSYEQ